MAEVREYTTYTRAGNALVQSAALKAAGGIGKLLAEPATISEARYTDYAKGVPCVHGTPALRSLEIQVRFYSAGYSLLYFLCEEDINAILLAHQVAEPTEIVGRSVNAFCLLEGVGPRLVGLGLEALVAATA